MFPDRFGSLTGARAFIAAFVEGYNHSHRHTGLRLNKPADVHYGLAANKAGDRSAVLAQARLSTPDRFATSMDPRILTLPGPAWINRPVEVPAFAGGVPQLAALSHAGLIRFEKFRWGEAASSLDNTAALIRA